MRNKLSDELVQTSFADQETSLELAKWNPYDPHVSSDFFEPLWMFDRTLERGFDIVIQNPPYISHDRLNSKVKAYIKETFQSWEAFADIYCYFIERACNLLSENGVSCSITSNSFLRAEYGAPLREYLVNETGVLQLISIDESQVFENAIVNVAILVFRKESKHIVKNSSYKACRGELVSQEFREYVLTNGFNSELKTLDRNVWSLSTEKEMSIIECIESRGTPLITSDAKIRLGLATGDNKAFLVSKQQKDYFVSDESNAESILKPVLRGRGIDRFRIKEINEFLILSKNGVNLPRDYPILASHLNSFGDSFKRRGAKGQEWWNLRACSFYEDFEKNKVVWIELTNQPRFAVCPAGIYLLNSAYFLLPPKSIDAYTITAFFNSSVCEFYAIHSAQTSGMGTMRWIKAHVSKIPIPNFSKDESTNLERLGRLCSLYSGSDLLPENKFLENLIDACVMEIYFYDHMSKRDLLFHAETSALLVNYDQNASKNNQHEFLKTFYKIANAPDHPIRNRLLRLTADSPDLLAVIKSEGKA